MRPFLRAELLGRATSDACKQIERQWDNFVSIPSRLVFSCHSWPYHNRLEFQLALRWMPFWYIST